MAYLAVAVFLFLVGLAGLIAKGLHRLVIGMSDPGAHLEPIELEEGTPEFEAAMALDVWAESTGYGWNGAWVTRIPGVPPGSVCAWGDERGTCVALYRLSKHATTIDIVTNLDAQRRVALTTSSTKGASLFPKRSGVFRQMFPGATVEELAAAHAEALDYLSARLRVRPVPYDGDFDRYFMESLRTQMDHVRGHVLWPIRGVWWVLRRHRFDGVSVEDRYPDIMPTDVQD